MLPRIKLTKGVSNFNLVAFYYATIVGLCLIIFMNAIQPLVLTNLMQFPQERQGQLIGTLTAIQEITILIVIVFIGVISDKTGRKIVFISGFGLFALTFLLYPHSLTESNLILYRILFACGIASTTSMFSAIIADYVLEKDIGKAVGAMGFCFSIGAVIATSVFLGIPNTLKELNIITDFASGIRGAFYVAAFVSILSGLFLLIGLKSGIVGEVKEKKLWQLLIDGMSAARDPNIALTYAAAFVSRGDLILAGQFISLWINKYGTQNLGLKEFEISREIQISLTIIQIASLVVATPFIIFFSDRINKMTLIAVSAFLSAIGYCSLIFIQDPLGINMKFCLFIVGTGEIMLALASQVLIVHYAPKEIRGVVIGGYGFFGSLGIMVASLGGGYLFDNLGESVPFFFFGVLGFVITLISLLIRKSEKLETTSW